MDFNQIEGFLMGSSIVGLSDRPWTTPLLAELLSTNSNTLLLLNSSCHSHLIGTIAKSFIWHMSWSPTRSRRRSGNPSCTRSCTTSRFPFDSSNSTAPNPATSLSKEPSVNTRTVRVTHRDRPGLDAAKQEKDLIAPSLQLGQVAAPFVYQGKNLKQAYFRDLPPTK